MSAPTNEASEFAAWRARISADAAICDRGDRIVARVLGPVEPAPHGFYDPHGFVASCRRSAARNQLRRDVIARLFAKRAARDAANAGCGA